MKLQIIISLLFLSITLNAQLGVQFPDSGGVWKETYCWQPGPFFYNGIGEKYLSGDTVINDTLYRKVYHVSKDVFSHIRNNQVSKFLPFRLMII